MRDQGICTQAHTRASVSEPDEVTVEKLERSGEEKILIYQPHLIQCWAVFFALLSFI